MTGFWLLSYIVLWLLLVGLSLLMLGLLRQVGLLQRQLDRFVDREQGTTDTDFIPLEKDGPAIGSILPELTVRLIHRQPWCFQLYPMNMEFSSYL